MAVTCIEFVRNGKIIYVEDTINGQVMHYTTDQHWGEYLRFRKCIPSLVKIMGDIASLRALLEERGILV